MKGGKEGGKGEGGDWREGVVECESSENWLTTVLCFDKLVRERFKRVSSAMTTSVA